MIMSRNSKDKWAEPADRYRAAIMKERGSATRSHTSPSTVSSGTPKIIISNKVALFDRAARTAAIFRTLITARQLNGPADMDSATNLWQCTVRAGCIPAAGSDRLIRE